MRFAKYIDMRPEKDDAYVHKFKFDTFDFLPKS